MADAATCPQSIKDALGDDIASVEWVSEDKGCLQSNENRLHWVLQVVKDGKKIKTASMSWGCYCSANQPTNKLRPGMYLTAYSGPLYELCSSDGACSGCAPTCRDRGDGQKYCRGGANDEDDGACYTGAYSHACLHVANEQM